MVSTIRGRPVEHQMSSDLEDHDRGLSHDLPTLLNRRRALGLAGGAGIAAFLAACGSGSEPSASSPSATASGPGGSGGGPGGPGGAPPGGEGGGATVGEGEIPAETGGPYPADGSNGVNVLTASGVVRSDITRSFGTASGVAAGVPLTVRLKVLDVSAGGGAVAGAAVYLWHCDRNGDYSLYSPAVAKENYLRGVQETGPDGTVTFTTIYPAAYLGRWPHMHFEVYPSLAKATTASDKLRTTQLALPEATSSQVYATSGYEQSVLNMAQTSLSTDTVFSDGYSLQMATITGSVDRGLTATLNVPV
jgi:protocatechuate 3,4-dioxygenase beta subunit